MNTVSTRFPPEGPYPVLQLAHIDRPVETLEEIDRIRGEGPRIPPKTLVEDLQFAR